MVEDIIDILANEQPNQKVNFDKCLQKMIHSWQQRKVKPKILLHSCCAPCSTYTLEYLTQYAEVAIYFANSNIHPQSEYQRRALVQAQFIEQFNQKTNQNVQFIEAPYHTEAFNKMVIQQQLQDEKEGGLRCGACFQYRLDLVAQKAQELGYDYFGSALTISPKKNSQLINQKGIEVQHLYQVKYLPSDFKKNNGYYRSVEMCKEYNIYRQCYCGCIFAARQQGIDLKQIQLEAQEFVKRVKADLNKE